MNTFSTLQILTGVIIWFALVFVSTFTIYSFVDRLEMKHPFMIGESGRWTIFFGIPAIGCAVVLCKGRSIAHAVGEQAYPYVFLGTMIAFIVCGMILYNFIPKRLVLPLGIAGWTTSFAIMFWYFWFGPGFIR